ncbi:MAG: hypothetical protein KGL36_08825, partial [Gammaproteobacteria bacterium]|nr:hypothetical protein [Gammaproteobacteria bacterium]
MGGSKTAIFTQVVHFYPDGVGHITVGGNTGVMPDSVPLAWRTLSLDERNAVRHAGLNRAGFPGDGYVLTGGL